MGMHVHEVHAAVIHAPLVLLPAAAVVDLSAAVGDTREGGDLGRKLWWLAVGAGALAGVAGFAASQEVKTDEGRAEDMMWLHGVGNSAILLGGVGIALWRTFRPPTVAQAAVGLAATGLALYTAYLGGEMVYAHGVGVRALGDSGRNGVRESPPVLSSSAPATFFRDCAKGVAWLIRRALPSERRQRRLAAGAFRG
jgi:uncharacterized membrane protein